MRLCLIAERFPPDIGGLAKSGARTAETLARIGVDVTVLAFTRAEPPGALRTERLESGVTLHRFGLFANLDLSLQHAMNLLEHLHHDEALDVLWGHYLFPAGFVAVLAAEMLGVRSTVSARGNDVDRMMFPPGDFARLKWTLERADVVTAVSDELKRKIAIVAQRPAETIPNAVDLDRFHGGPADPALRARLDIAPEETILGFCGELRHKKGFPFLLDALVRTRAERPAALLVIGEVRSAEVPHLQAFAAEHPEAAKRIVVTGRLDEPDEVAAHYRLCDVYLQPSVWEGLPNALLEAMACERVVIASDAGGIREAVEHGRSGFLLPRTKLHQLGPAVLELLAQPEAARADLGRAARERIASRYAPAHEEAALAQIVAALAARL
jgi:glycosyltransferase involved in cell wall biosynthesis